MQVSFKVIITKPHLVLFFTLVRSNIFVSVIEKIKSGGYTLIFTHFWPSGLEVSSISPIIKRWSLILDKFIIWLKSWYKQNNFKLNKLYLSVVLKGFGGYYNRRRSFFNYQPRRKLILSRLKKARFRLISVFDTSSVAFNGCKLPARRRRRVGALKRR